MAATVCVQAAVRGHLARKEVVSEVREEFSALAARLDATEDAQCVVRWPSSTLCRPRFERIEPPLAVPQPVAPLETTPPAQPQPAPPPPVPPVVALRPTRAPDADLAPTPQDEEAAAQRVAPPPPPQQPVVPEPARASEPAPHAASEATYPGPKWNARAPKTEAALLGELQLAWSMLQCRLQVLEREEAASRGALPAPPRGPSAT
mmetsp:Transcript_7264/g.22357  ORF Transcript_7264/g.22357 Transcript_7264/m.22357 type:complete len:205 (-) Transcript_7264:134-748(-)